MMSVFNPFHKLAGGKALMIGAAFAAATLIVSLYSHSLFDGVVDFHVVPFDSALPYLICYGVAWLSLVVFFGLAGMIFSKNRFRWIDILGMTLLSRAPLLLIAVAAFAIPYVSPAELAKLSELQFSTGFYAASALALLCIIWTIALYYNGYRICLNLKGPKAIWSFIVVIILSEITALFIIHLLPLK